MQVKWDPAFYGEWFAGRIAAGYLWWTNPFNRQQQQIISFAKARVIVFWSKNPAPIERYLDQLDARGINYYSRYRKVRENLKRSGTGVWEEPGREAVPEIAKGIQGFNRNWGLRIASCAEDVDLSAFDIAHNRCIDDDLMVRVFPRDSELMELLGRSAEPLFEDDVHAANRLKDGSQREPCGCVVSKDIGRYNTCPHHCAYCYANSSFEQADDAIRRHRPGNEEI